MRGVKIPAHSFTFSVLALASLSVSAVRANEVFADSGETVELDPLTVYSDAVALQQPATTFAMPVTLLRFEPLVDVQGRGMAEAQADVSIRGGTFENTGFSIGALPIYDPQTGHYFAELPVAPAMLGAPAIRVGAAQAASGWNATAGGVAYGWSRIREGAHGFVTGTAGGNSLVGGEVYSSFTTPEKILGGRMLGFDVSVAASQGDGSRPDGDHDFARYAGRVQLADERSQTDFFAGYQSKDFGWPNLYTPYGVAEREDIQTELYAVNHRVELGAGDGDYFQVGAYHRIQRDHYSIPAFVFNNFHTNRVSAVAAEGRASVNEAWALRYRAGVIADEIKSNALIVGPMNGRYDDRTQVYAGLFAEHTTELEGGREVVLLGGGNFEDSNRAGSAFSPVAEVALVLPEGVVRRAYVSYAESTQLPTYTALNGLPTGLFASNRDLGRSMARNFEVGAEGVVAGWSTRAAVFYRQDRDLVDWTYSNALPNSRRASAVDIDTLGFELVTRRSFEKIDLIFGYTALTKDDNYGPGVDASFYALNYAEHRVTAALVWRLAEGLEVRMDNEARFQAENALRNGGDDKLLSALGVSYAVPRVAGLTLGAQVDNLWNTYFEEVPRVPGAKREWSVSATYAW